MSQLGGATKPEDPELLTGSEVGAVLQAALTPVGGEVVSWQVQQVDHQPRSGSTAAYRVRVRWPDGVVSAERFGVFTGVPPPGALTVGDGVGQVAVWRFPHDPYLPALAAAYDPAAVARLLSSFGLGKPDQPVRLYLRAYRARRRAVVEAVGPVGRLFLKVVHPNRVEQLHQRHRLVTSAGVPVPPSLGWNADGLLVLGALPGQPLRQALRAGDTRLPGGEAIGQLLDQLPAELAQGPPRRSWLTRTGHYADVLAGIVPRQAERVRQLARAITAEGGTGPTVPAHGDFYENQLRISGGRITGLLDIDTAGPGERLDDLGCLLGHLAVLAELEPAHAAAINRTGSSYLAAFDRAVDPASLRCRVAAVVLSLATGPYRVQEPGWQQATAQRVELAEQWLVSARVVAAAGA